IELDNGYGRSGLTTDQAESMKEIVRITENAENMTFKGFLTHAGNTYNARGKQEIMVIMEDTAGQLRTLKARYADRFPGIITSYGDTPSCSLAEDLSAFDEIRPGNFVYYDVMQYHIGSCTLDDIAVCVACPVVGIYPERNELVIYGGAVHLSKEFIAGDNGFKLFGYIVETDGNDWSEPVPGAYVSSLSQEHGVVHMPSEWISKFKPGDLLGVLPVHSCLAADVLNDEGLPAEA
ncbi:MAG: alanine racemase, partial [bacterium]